MESPFSFPIVGRKIPGDTRGPFDEKTISMDLERTLA
jgi:hypothetical protein